MGVVRFVRPGTHSTYVTTAIYVEEVFDVDRKTIGATSQSRPLTSTESSHLRPSDIRTMGLGDVQLSLLCCISSVSPFRRYLLIPLLFALSILFKPRVALLFVVTFLVISVEFNQDDLSRFGRNGSPGPTSAGYKGQKILHIFAIRRSSLHSSRALRQNSSLSKPTLLLLIINDSFSIMSYFTKASDVIFEPPT